MREPKVELVAAALENHGLHRIPFLNHGDIPITSEAGWHAAE